MARSFRRRFLQTDADADVHSPTALLDSLLLSSVGALVAHQVAYSIAPLLGQANLVGHGHLDLAWKLSLLAGVVGMTGVVLRSLRSRNYRVANPVCTGVGVAASFTLMETLERIANGISPSELATELVFWLGLAATVPITFIYTYALRAVSVVANGLLDRRPLHDWPTIFSCSPLAERPFSLASFNHSWSLWGRGPPTRSASTPF